MRTLGVLSLSPFSPEDVINKLIPNGIWPVITQLLTTIVLFLIVYKLLYKPVRQMLDKRATFIKRNIDEAARDSDLASKKLTEAEKKINAAKLEAQRLVKDAKEDMEIARLETLEETKQQQRRLKLQAEDDIEASRLQALENIRKEMVALALEASEKVLERELVAKDDEKIVDDYIKGRLN